jgi:hypothetical protein
MPTNISIVVTRDTNLVMTLRNVNSAQPPDLIYLLPLLGPHLKSRGSVRPRRLAARSVGGILPTAGTTLLSTVQG